MFSTGFNPKAEDKPAESFATRERRSLIVRTIPTTGYGRICFKGDGRWRRKRSDSGKPRG